jgi:hypothetical protein
VVLIDNVKGKINSSSFESMLTRKTIDGKRMYHGQFSRPNYLTWIITANTPRLSEDMTVRSVVIRLGKQKHGKAWVAWAADFIRQHRLSMIHDCLAVLRGAPLGSIDADRHDRFQAWQLGVLSRCSPSADRLAQIIIDRRGEVNADSDDAEEIANALNAWCDQPSNACKGSCGIYRIDRKQMRELLVAADIIGQELAVKGVHTWLSDLRGSEPLHPLKDLKSHRMWEWNRRNFQQMPDIPV